MTKVLHPSFSPGPLRGFTEFAPMLCRKGLAWLSQVNVGVFALRHDGEILKPIIQPIMVKVVHLFPAFKIPAKVGFHYEAMLKDIAFVGRWMKRLMNPAVAEFVYPCATLPGGMCHTPQVFIPWWAIDRMESPFLGRVSFDIRKGISLKNAVLWVVGFRDSCGLATSTGTRRINYRGDFSSCHAMMITWQTYGVKGAGFGEI